MPFAVLLEVALQPCGWLAAYMGSALTSDDGPEIPQSGRVGLPAPPGHRPGLAR